MSIKIKILLTLIILFAFILRVWNIGNYPDLNPDEAALGYNAYSLLQTGKDEHGQSYPIHFKSFGDYKPGGYVYLTMPFIKILGLNPLAVRLPNLLLAVISIYFLYQLVYLLSSSNVLSLLSISVLALNPWHIHFSRGAWESSAALSITIIAIYYFYSYLIKQNQKHLIFSAVLFVLPLYLYHSSRIYIPLLLLSFLFLYKKTLLKNIKHLVLPLLLIIILSVPVLTSFLTSGGSTRFNGVGIFADQGPFWRANELLNQHSPTIYYRIIHNQRILYLISWVQKYLSHFDLNYLFHQGDEVPRSKIPNIGQFYLFELPLLLIGIIQLFKQKKSYLFHLTILLLIISPLASSLTFQAPSALRSLPLSIPISIIIAYGLQKVISKYAFLIITSYFLSVGFYLYNYYLNYIPQYPSAWNAGFSEAINKLNQIKNKYEAVYFTNKYDQPYILYLFFSQYPPRAVQSQISLTIPDSFGFSTVKHIDSITFDKISWENITPNSLIISDNPSLSGKIIYQVKKQNQTLFTFYEK